MLYYLAFLVSGKSNGLMPIFVKLSDFSKEDIPLEEFLIKAVLTYIPSDVMEENARTAIKNNNVIILLDGLDEVSRNRYSIVTEKICNFINANKDNKVIITSRKTGFKTNQIPYRIFEIDKLPISEIREFISKWFPDGNDLSIRVESTPRILELAHNPFLLSIICFIFEKDKELPKRRLELYKKCAITLLTLFDEKEVDKVNVFTRLLKEKALVDIAYNYFVKGKNEFEYDSLIENISDTLKNNRDVGLNYNEEKILNEICENSGILQKSDDNYIFVHRTFFEYYVSKKMRKKEQKEILEYAKLSSWEEPIRLYAAQIESETEGTDFLKRIWEIDRALALRCYPDMDNVVKAETIKEMLGDAKVKERIELVKGLPEKISEPGKIVETLSELFRWETNGEVIYWGVKILEERKTTPGAIEVVKRKLDYGANKRYEEFVKSNMVEIKKGSFMMGSEEDDDEKPIHKVELDGFLLSRYQVTNELYEKFDPGHKNMRDKYSNQDDQPVIYVNWYEVIMFCKWLGCGLPTEVQWEYACRAGTNTQFNIGDKLTTNDANFGDKIGRTTPIGNYKSNNWELYDMHGNVLEWCNDWYDKEYYKECIKRQLEKNPKGPIEGSNCVLCGGYWFINAKGCRSAFRYFIDPADCFNFVGFRLVRPSV